MQVPVGPHVYDVRLVGHDLLLDGQRCDGWCDLDRQRILIRGALPPTRRIATCWHELAHAWAADLDVTASGQLPEEAVCNLVGLAMVHMSPQLLARLHVYLTRGIDAEAVMMLPRVPQAIPVLRFTASSSDSG